MTATSAADARPAQRPGVPWIRAGATLAALLPAAAACGLGGPAYRAPPTDVAAVVDMDFFSFEPSEVTVRAGETVEWRNTAPMRHTVTADPERADDPANVALPDGAEPFHSGNIPAGEIYRHRFTVPGTYRYFCVPHESDGMVATVVVQPAA